MRKAKQISVSLENRAGRLARFCQYLAQKNINIIAISVAETSEQGVVRIVVDKQAAALKAIAECGPMTCAQTDVLLIDLPNRIGSLGKMVDKLAAKRINVDFVYGSAGLAGRKSYIVVGAPNIESVARAIRSRK